MSSMPMNTKMQHLGLRIALSRLIRLEKSRAGLQLSASTRQTVLANTQPQNIRAHQNQTKGSLDKHKQIQRYLTQPDSHPT